MANFGGLGSALPRRSHELRIPCLVITGDDDRLVSKEESERLVRDLPGATLVTISDCGHLPHEERPEEFMRVVEAFVREQQILG